MHVHPRSHDLQWTAACVKAKSALQHVVVFRYARVVACESGRQATNNASIDHLNEQSSNFGHDLRVKE